MILPVECLVIICDISVEANNKFKIYIYIYIYIYLNNVGLLEDLNNAEIFIQCWDNLNNVGIVKQY